ncbi:MAG: DNA-processing protein DprA [Solirubrobacteraceae bacterium]
MQSSLLALCAIDHVNWHVIAREAQRPGGLEQMLRGELSENSKEARATQKLLATADLKLARARAAEELRRAQDEVGAKLVTVLDDDYPANLRVIYNLPPFLFYRGRLDREDARSVAVVGTRDASTEGISSARRMARSLAQNHVTVLSGLARGIDTVAHEETLAQGGRTIAVLGTGILSCYPKENADLAERIVETGALVSQFWPTQPPTRYTFPRRNVVTSGMSQGTVVIEASNTSGAKMQARLALEHGKRVFLVSRLVTAQTWAQKYVSDRGAIEIKSVDEVLARLRSPEQIELLAAQRQQLTLELA